MDNSLLLGLLAKGGGGGGSPEGSAIKSTGEAAGEVLMTDGAGGAVWTPDMTDTEIDLLFIEKGAILKMNLDGTERSYRVLKNVSGSVFEVLGMFSTGSVAYNTTSTTDTFSDGTVGQKYAGSDLDTALNTTWYNTLSADAKEAIVDKNVVQDMWYSSGAGDPDYAYKNVNEDKTISPKSGATLAAGSRHVYTIKTQDVIDYLEATPQMTTSNTTLTSANIKTMVQGTGATLYAWLMTAAATPSGSAWNYMGETGKIDTGTVGNSRSALPVFQIDLSKITYTEV